MNISTIVTVVFSQHGTWGSVGFKGELFWEEISNNMMAEFLGEPYDPEYAPALRIVDGPKQYIDLVLRPGQDMPGMYAEGYSHPLSGKCFVGELKVGTRATDLDYFRCPEYIYHMSIGYLHIPKDSVLDDDQKQLLLEAVRYDRDKRFPAGRSVCELFTRDELEGEKKGKVFYA